MSHPDLLSELRTLTNLSAPVGFEEPILNYVREQWQRCCERVEQDARGNVYAWQPGSDPQAPVIMLTAHADEIGFIVTSILPNGFLRFTKLGQPTDAVLPGQRVRVLTPMGPLEGVIGVRPGHILTPEQARQVPRLNEMYLDIGARSDQEALAWGIEPGTPAVFVGELTATHLPGRYFGKSVDNRLGIACLLQLARQWKHETIAVTRVFVLTVEEEIGLRGASVAAMKAQPDVVLAIDTVPAGGTPELSRDELPWEIGAGPLLKILEGKGLVTHRPLRELFRQVAEETGIPYQLIVDTAGITDASSAQQASGDIAALVLGLARRYSHSAVEMFDLADAEHLVEWISVVVPRLVSKSQLMRR